MANGWYGLMGILQSAREQQAEDARREVVECPNDGQALLTNVNGVRYCPFCGERFH